jgi:hypothetical protein
LILDSRFGGSDNIARPAAPATPLGRFPGCLATLGALALAVQSKIKNLKSKMA